MPRLGEDRGGGGGGSSCFGETGVGWSEASFDMYTEISAFVALYERLVLFRVSAQSVQSVHPVQSGLRAHFLKVHTATPMPTAINP